MKGSGGRPILLVDVDGVLSLFGFGTTPPAGLVLAAIDGIPHFLSPHAAARLNRLAATFQCAWCTGWEERAEEHLPRLLGLPGGWPHLTLPRQDAAAGRHWKLGAIESWAGPATPLAWIDDDHDASCEAWAASRAAPTLLVRTEPATGLGEVHVTRLESWARSL
jgi:hypothetical protein